MLSTSTKTKLIKKIDNNCINKTNYKKCLYTIILLLNNLFILL